MSSAMTGCAARTGRCAMRHDPASAAIVIMLRSLKMYGMAQAVDGPDRTGRARLRGGRADPVATAEGRDGGTRGPVHRLSHSRPRASRPTRTWPGSTSPPARSTRPLVRQLHRCEFIDGAHNVVLIGGPGTGKTHVATALGVQADRAPSKEGPLLLHDRAGQRARAGEGQGQGRADRREPARALDLVILDELGYLPFSAIGRGVALPPAEQALRAHQRRHHHQSQLQRMGHGLR